MGKGVFSILQGRISGASWAAEQTVLSIRAELPAAGAKGDQHGMGQHFGEWSSAVSAVVWRLLYLERGVLHPSGSLDKCLSTPDG